jgi:hypothetical protein
MDSTATNYNPDANGDTNCLINTGPNWYVAVDGDDINGDGSEEFPFATIQQAINSSADGNTVHVSTGTYEENIIWPAISGISLVGADRETTIIDGGAAATVVSLTDVGYASISGFTITNGQFEENEDASLKRSGGIDLIGSTNATLSDLHLTENSGYNGGAIYVDYNSDCELSNSLLDYNTASFGGGIRVAGVLNLNFVDIVYNSSAISFYNGQGEINNSKISHNDDGISITGANWGEADDWESPGLIFNNVEIADNKVGSTVGQI